MAALAAFCFRWRLLPCWLWALPRGRTGERSRVGLGSNRGPKTRMTTQQKNNGQLSASFRDPSGFLFSRNGVLYRQINPVYEKEYTRFMESGLYERLVKAGLLIPHREVDQAAAESEAPPDGER